MPLDSNRETAFRVLRLCLLRVVHNAVPPTFTVFLLQKCPLIVFAADLRGSPGFRRRFAWLRSGASCPDCVDYGRRACGLWYAIVGGPHFQGFSVDVAHTLALGRLCPSCGVVTCTLRPPSFAFFSDKECCLNWFSLLPSRFVISF